MENLSKILPSIGAMDEEIRIRTYTTSRDAAAQEVLTWSTYATLLARVQWPEAGMKETYSADQQTAFRKVVFWIRYDASIHPKMIILYGPHICDILGIREEGRRRYTVITCQMRDSDTVGITDNSGLWLTDGSGNILTTE